jgi:TIR domain
MSQCRLSLPAISVPREEMLTAILAAAGRWMEFGLPLNRLRIVMHRRDPRNAAIAAFDDFAHAFQRTGSTPGSAATTEATPVRMGNERDATVFVSYAHADGRSFADEIRWHISEIAPNVRTLLDIADIDVGLYWQTRIAELIQSSNMVVLVVTEGFWQSNVCLEEYNMARVLDSDRGGGVLFPIYARSCDLPLHFRILNYADCREADQTRLREACDRLVATLGPRKNS